MVRRVIDELDSRSDGRAIFRPAERGASGSSRVRIHFDDSFATARAIKFEPKMKDGKPVSVVIVREYNFSTY